MTCTDRSLVSGFSLTEMAIVLGIIGILLSAVWAGYSVVTMNNLIRLASQELETISQNVRAVYAEQGGIVGGTGSNINQALDQLRVFPLNMRQGGTASGVIFNPFKPQTSTNAGGIVVGNVQVYADSCVASPGNTVDNESSTGPGNVGTNPQPCFGITFSNVPSRACDSLVSENFTDPLLQRIFVNGTLVYDKATLALSETTLNSSCTNTGNSVLWVYLLRDNKS